MQTVTPPTNREHSAAERAPCRHQAATAGSRDRSIDGSILTHGRWRRVMLVLAAASMLVIMLSLRAGAENIPFAEALRILWRFMQEGQAGVETSGSSGVILMQVRLPRVILAFLVGGSLAAVGVGLQALLRNPLADPYVLGISSGAALGAACAMLFGLGVTAIGISLLPLCAFGGGLLSILLVYRIAVSHGHLPLHTLLLAGVILNAVFSALIMFMTSIMDPNRSFGMMSWLMGTLLAPDYPALLALALYLGIGGIVLFAQARPLNLLAFGEQTARSLGIEVESVKKRVFVTSALLTGAVVSVSGLIGFVGMVIPHAVRIVVGADHRLLLPASALAGGMFLTAADALARTLLAPGEIPVGVVTALAGGPFFLYLLMRRKGEVI